MLTDVKNRGLLPSVLKGVSFIYMTEDEPNRGTPRWRMWLFLVIFISSAAWGGCVLAEQAGKKGATKPVDPLEDRSLFGR